MATINGTAVNFGFQGTNGITITGLSGTLLQSAKQRKKADSEVTRDGLGEEVAHAWYNIHDEAELEFVVTGTGLAVAITNTAAMLKTPGTIITITACTSMPDLITSVWEVQDGAEVSGSNTTSKRATIPLKRFTNITAAAGA